MDKEMLKLIATKDDVKGLMTKNEFTEFKDESLTQLDKMMTILRRLDEERLFTFETVKRIEEEVEKQRQQIKAIKEVLRIH